MADLFMYSCVGNTVEAVTWIYIKGGVFYDTLGSEVPKIAFSQLWPQLLMDRADFWHGDSFLVELHLKLAIFPFGPPPLPPAPP